MTAPTQTDAVSLIPTQTGLAPLTSELEATPQSTQIASAPPKARDLLFIEFFAIT